MRPSDDFIPDFDDDDDDERPITCNRCGEEGLFWMNVTQADGKSEKPALFNASHRRHVCKVNDFFKVEPE